LIKGYRNASDPGFRHEAPLAFGIGDLEACRLPRLFPPPHKRYGATGHSGPRISLALQPIHSAVPLVEDFNFFLFLNNLVDPAIDTRLGAIKQVSEAFVLGRRRRALGVVS